MRSKKNCTHIFAALFSFLLLGGCGGGASVSSELHPSPPEKELPLLGFSIQVGAFSNLDNAIRLNASLETHGLDPYYFVHKTGLYKVRFGNFPSRKAALKKAESFRIAGVIDAYYIVSPADYAVAGQRRYGNNYLRDQIVGTAESFLSLPYQWGGSSADTGFDCSGLSMAVYRLNGLHLPRSSAAQYRAGTTVSRNHLKKGDLVFFATSWGRQVSHVGIYSGNNIFIHSPRKGKRIRKDSMSNRYFQERYVGAMTYLR